MTLDGDVCNADIGFQGVNMSQIQPILRYSGNCQKFYASTVTCKVSHIVSGQGSVFTSYSNCEFNDRNIRPKVCCKHVSILQNFINFLQCTTGLYQCLNYNPIELWNFGYLVPYLAFELVCFVMLVTRCRHQPLRARNPFILIVSFLIHVLFGITFGVLRFYLPCPIFSIVVLVIVPLCGIGYIARFIYLIGIWKASSTKKMLAKLIRNKYSSGTNTEQVLETPTSATSTLTQISNNTLTVVKLPKQSLSTVAFTYRIYKAVGNGIWVTLGLYLLAFVVYAAIYVILLIVYSTDTNNGAPVLIGLHNCVIPDAITYTLLASFVLFFVITFIFSIIICCNLRDGYGIWWLSIIDSLLPIIIIVIIVVLSALSVTLNDAKLGARPFMVVIWLVLTHLIQILLPAFHSFCWSKSKKFKSNSTSEREGEINGIDWSKDVKITSVTIKHVQLFLYNKTVC